MISALPLPPEIEKGLREARRVLIATDFDGTLCPIAERPSKVQLAPAMQDILSRAAVSQSLTVAVISGRAVSDLQSRLPLDLLFSGNHGLQVVGRGLSFVHQGARQLRFSLSGACETLARTLRSWPGAWIENKGLSATLHFREVEECHHHALLLAAGQALGTLNRHLDLSVGKQALEIRPNVHWDKGSALRYIQNEAGPFDVCICLGDDRTDEDMFRANRGQFNVGIGTSKLTAITHVLSDAGEVAVLLSKIVELRGWSRHSHVAACAVAARTSAMGGSATAHDDGV